MKIQYVPTDSLHPYEKNPRVITEAAIDAVAKSIHEFGFRQPIVVDSDFNIVAGHTRLLAARKLQLAEVPVHVADNLSDEQVRALRIADNKTGEFSTWDLTLLPAELLEIQATGFDLDLIGFSEADISVMLSDDITGGETDPNSIPQNPDAAKTKPGDIWMLGRHRLMCGDSGNREHLDALLAGQPIHLVNMDPPYNVKVEPRSNNAIAAGLSSFAAPEGSHHQKFDLERHPEKKKASHKKLRAKDRPLMNDFVGEAEFEKMLMDWFGNAARVLIPGGGFYIWGGYANCANYPPALKANGLYFSQAIIWDKQHPVLTRKDFMGAHEWCFYGWKEGAAHRFYGPNNATDLWHIKKVNPQSMVHLTEKPVELAVRSIQYSSHPGENVLDLFGGSGSTLIGCEQTNRNGFLMELDPLYCDVIVDRFQRFSGIQGVIQGTGESPIPMAEADKKSEADNRYDRGCDQDIDQESTQDDDVPL